MIQETATLRFCHAIITSTTLMIEEQQDQVAQGPDLDLIKEAEVGTIKVDRDLPQEDHPEEVLDTSPMIEEGQDPLNQQGISKVEFY